MLMYARKTATNSDGVEGQIKKHGVIKVSPIVEFPPIKWLPISLEDVVSSKSPPTPLNTQKL